MMLPPSRRQDPRLVLELELASLAHRIRRLELAQENPIAWLALNIAAIALGIEAPADELARLWFSQGMLKAALYWYEGRP